MHRVFAVLSMWCVASLLAGCGQQALPVPERSEASEPRELPALVAPPAPLVPAAELVVPDLTLESVLAEAMTNSSESVDVSDRLIKQSGSLPGLGHDLEPEELEETPGGGPLAGFWVKVDPGTEEDLPVTALEVPVPGSGVSVGRHLGEGEEQDMTTIRLRAKW